MMNGQEEALDIEFRLWSYLDNDCTADERQRIAALIDSSPRWRQKHDEMYQLHHHLSKTLELEQPSMRFTQNVLESVKDQTIFRPAGSYLNHWVIRGIIAFFIIVTGYYFFGLISSIRFRSDSASSALMKQITMPLDFSGHTVIWGFLFFSVIAGLILVDTLIHKRRLQYP